MYIGHIERNLSSGISLFFDKNYNPLISLYVKSKKLLDLNIYGVFYVLFLTTLNMFMDHYLMTHTFGFSEEIYYLCIHQILCFYQNIFINFIDNVVSIFFIESINTNNYIINVDTYMSLFLAKLSCAANPNKNRANKTNKTLRMVFDDIKCDVNQIYAICLNPKIYLVCGITNYTINLLTQYVASFNLKNNSSKKLIANNTSFFASLMNKSKEYIKLMTQNKNNGNVKSYFLDMIKDCMFTFLTETSDIITVIGYLLGYDMRTLQYFTQAYTSLNNLAVKQFYTNELNKECTIQNKQLPEIIDVNSIDIELSNDGLFYTLETDQLFVANHTDLNFNKNDVVILSGNNGYGKTTFINCLMGIKSFDDDVKYYVNNKLFTTESHLNVAAYVQDMYGRFFCAKDLYTYVYPYYEVCEVENKQELMEKALENSGCDKFSRNQTRFSSGELNKIAMATVWFKLFMDNSKIVILDEIDAHMSDDTKLEVLGKLIQYCKQNEILLFIVTHSTIIKQLPDVTQCINFFKKSEIKTTKIDSINNCDDCDKKYKVNNDLDNGTSRLLTPPKIVSFH